MSTVKNIGYSSTDYKKFVDTQLPDIYIYICTCGLCLCLEQLTGRTCELFTYMDVCMLNIYLHWGTLHWQYGRRGLVYMYMCLLKYFLLGNNPQSVMSVEDLLYCLLYTNYITDVVCMYFVILFQQTQQ